MPALWPKEIYCIFPTAAMGPAGSDSDSESMERLRKARCGQDPLEKIRPMQNISSPSESRLCGTDPLFDHTGGARCANRTRTRPGRAAWGTRGDQREPIAPTLRPLPPAGRPGQSTCTLGVWGEASRHLAGPCVRIFQSTAAALLRKDVTRVGPQAPRTAGTGGTRFVDSTHDR